METTTIKNETEISTVRLLREIRDKINEEIKNMTFEEERAYLDKILEKRQENKKSK